MFYISVRLVEFLRYMTEDTVADVVHQCGESHDGAVPNALVQA